MRCEDGRVCERGADGGTVCTRRPRLLHRLHATLISPHQPALVFHRTPHIHAETRAPRAAALTTVRSTRVPLCRQRHAPQRCVNQARTRLLSRVSRLFTRSRHSNRAPADPRPNRGLRTCPSPHLAFLLRPGTHPRSLHATPGQTQSHPHALVRSRTVTRARPSARAHKRAPRTRAAANGHAPGATWHVRLR